jgi:AcrR family transcriptional regulator
MQTRKAELLDALIAYLQRHGLADLSLRPMAAATGTSARLLIFHFGSKERLLTEVLEEMQARLQRSFIALLSANKPGARRVPLMRAYWDWATGKENYAYHRLLYQLHILAAQDPVTYKRYLKRNSTNWLELVQPALPASQQTPAFATLYGAVFDGLFIELMSTGDHQRTTKALEEFIQMARKQIEAPKRSRSRVRADQPASLLQSAPRRKR